MKKNLSQRVSIFKYNGLRAMGLFLLLIVSGEANAFTHFLNEGKKHIKNEPFFVETICHDRFFNSKTENLKAHRRLNSNLQEHRIKGIVTDSSSGQPLIGVSIKVKNSDLGTVTDGEGRFSLNVPDDAILEITYLGYNSKEVATNGETSFNIVLSPSSSELNEVVVVGYGTQKKADLTGAIATIDNEKIKDKPVSSLTQALTGEAPGVTVIQRSSRPGAYDEFIRIRGVGTWGDSNPLVLVDGVESSMRNVNPDDVESISVLKDAAAAAIYGSRAGNGVILITTKQGKKNSEASIAYSGSFGFQVPTRLPNFNKTYDYYTLRNLELTDRGSSPVKDEQQMENFKKGIFDSDKNEANTDWLKEVLHVGVQQKHNVSVTGGGKRTSYRVSLGYFDQQSVIGDEDYFKKFNGRINTNTTVTDWLDVTTNLSYSEGYTREPMGVWGSGVLDIMQAALNSVPYFPVKYSDGTWAFLPSGRQNAVRMGFTKDYGYIKNDASTVVGYLSPKIDILEGLTLKGVISGTKSITNHQEHAEIVNFGEFAPSSDASPIQNAATGVGRSSKAENWSQDFNYTLNATLTYKKSFNRHSVKLLVGASRESFNNDFTNSSQMDLPSNNLDAIGAGTSTPIIDGTRITSTIASYFGRINYVFGGRYILEASIRRDGSSRFSEGHKWGTFPSYSVGWNVSREEFFKPVLPVINTLKLRASYGQLGNNKIADFKYLSIIAANNSTGYSFGGDAVSQGFFEQSMGNNLITWENLSSKNIGLDMEFFDNRLSISLDLYDRITKNILMNLPAPGTLGIAPPTTNAGSVRNRGWELTGGWKDKIGEVSYNISFNLSDVKNEILDLKDYVPPTSNLTIRKVGEPIDAIYGYESVGIMRTKSEVAKYESTMVPFYGGDLDGEDIVSRRFGLGDLAFKDLNGDGKIDASDKKIIGNQIPRYTYSFNLGANYKNLGIDLFFQGVGKVDGYLIYETRDNLYKPGNVYTENKSNVKFPRMGTYETMDDYNSFWVEDASYLRLKNIQVHYNFKDLHFWGIKNLDVYVSGENIFTLTKYRGWDPESPIGMRGWNYPMTKVYSFGVNLSF